MRRSVALGSVIIGLTAKDPQSRFALVALIPILSFWGLDAYYLDLEKSALIVVLTGPGNLNAASPSAGPSSAPTTSSSP